MTVELIGYQRCREMLEGVMHRSENPELALAPELLVLESEEQAIFAGLGGKFVDTGRTEASLTQTGGPDAIRLVHGAELVFGTAVEYARYLTTEDVGGHRHHLGSNAVFIHADEIVAADPAQRVLRRIVNGNALV